MVVLNKTIKFANKILQVNKKTLKILQDLAKELPPKTETAYGSEYGAKLIEQGVKTDKNGKPIDPKAKYKTQGLKLVNHFNKLKDIFKKNGNVGVLDYCNEIMPKPIVYEQIQEKLKEQNSNIEA